MRSDHFAVAENCGSALLPESGIAAHKSCAVVRDEESTADRFNQTVDVYTFGGFLGGEICSCSNELRVFNVDSLENRIINEHRLEEIQSEEEDDESEDSTTEEEYDSCAAIESSTTRSEAPKARSNHSFDYYKGNLVVFGGMSNHDEYLDDFYMFQTDTEQWIRIVNDPQEDTSNWPCGRSGHATCIYQDYMILSGGCSNENVVLDDIWLFDFRLKTWKQFHLSDSDSVVPCARYGHQIVSHPNQSYVILFGGENDYGTLLSDMYMLNLMKDSESQISVNKSYWSEITYANAVIPSPTNFMSLFLVESEVNGIELLLIGVYGHVRGDNSSLWMFNLDTREWSETEIMGDESPLPLRAYHSSSILTLNHKCVLFMLGGSETVDNFSSLSNSVYRITIT